MEIRLETLSATAFTLELPANASAPDRSVTLDEVAGLTGSLHTEPGMLRLAGARAESGIIGRLDWLIVGTDVKSEAPIGLSKPRLDSTHATGGSGIPLVMDAGASELVAAALALSSPTLRATTDLTATEVALQTEAGVTTVAAATAQAENLQLKTTSLFLRAAIRLAGLRLVSDGGIALALARAGSSHFRLEAGRLVVDATGFDCADGVAIKDGEVRLDSVHFEEVTITLDLNPSSEPAPAPEPDAPRVALVDDVITYGDRSLFDLRDLDRFAGAAEVGVFVKAQLPVVGKYRLDRTFKIPISDGSIDFVDLERQLGTIEDAFIDFAVRDGELILKRDIPLLPTKGKTLVRWPLSNVEQALAQSRLIRLRALSRAHVEPAKAGDKKATVTAVKVDVPHFEVALPAANDEQADAWGVVPAELHIRSIDKLAIGGSMLLNADADTRELGAQLRAEGLRMQLANVPVGTRQVFAQSIRCGDLDIHVPAWDGFRPRAVTIRAKDVLIERAGMRVQPPIEAAAATGDEASAASPPADEQNTPT